MDGPERLVDAPGQFPAVNKGTLRQTLMLAGAEGTLDVVPLRTVGRQKLEGNVGLGQCRPGAFHGSVAMRGRVVQDHHPGLARARRQGLQQKGLQVLTLQRSICTHPGQGRRGGGARCSLGGQPGDALPLRVLVSDARPLAGQGPSGGHGQGQGKTRCV